MEITIEKWQIEPSTETDVRTITFLLSTSLPDLPEKVVTVLLVGSLMTQLGEYVTAQYNSAEFESQLGRLAAALLKRELGFSRNLIYSAELKIGYTSDSFPFRAVQMPDISSPKGWTFTA